AVRRRRRHRPPHAPRSGVAAWKGRAWCTALWRSSRRSLTAVIGRFVKTKGWKDTESIVMGGGFRASRVGELAIGRAAVLLKAEGMALDFHPIRSHPDEARLVGAVHLMPSWMIEGYGGIL